MSNLVLIGLNHRTAGLDTRERAAFHPSKLAQSLRLLAARPSIREAMIVSTCNRVELLSVAENPLEGRESLEEFLLESSRLSRHQLDKKTYQHLEDDAVRHVFRVASSLDSMILGEAQILGQMKSFYQAAVEAGTVGTLLNGLLQAAFHTAKRVRTETNIGDYAVSVSSAAVELARKIFGNLRGATVLIVGAGKMGELACRQLGASGVGTVRVANRSTATAQEVAARFHGEVVPFHNLNHWIARSDIVITSTGSQEILIDHAAAQSVLAARKTPVVFIDI
jgi:glutamyl-tRNA reductase